MKNSEPCLCCQKRTNKHCYYKVTKLELARKSIFHPPMLISPDLSCLLIEEDTEAGEKITFWFSCRISQIKEIFTYFLNVMWLSHMEGTSFRNQTL